MEGAFSEHSAAVRAALDMISPDSALGLGTGRAASAFVRALGERCRAGLRVRGVPTSNASAELARSVGVPLTTLEETPVLDIDFDGADEVDPRGQLIKGLGGALVREKVVATAARRLVILVGPEKLVPALGAHGVLPVEVTPFALPVCLRGLARLGMTPRVREHEGKPFVSDNGNLIVDCGLAAPLADPHATDRAIRDLPGVVGTGLFLGFAPTVLVEEPSGVRVISPPASST